MDLIAESRAVRAFLQTRQAPGRSACVLVPTMGALHAGHAALIRQGAETARARGLEAGCVVSIFVNPSQFNEPSDFARYPRTLEADARLCQAAGAAVVLAPGADDVYPASHPVPVPALPPQATLPGLEDAARPGHFAGVCQVVARLFDMVRPAAAIFGEKDWQQLRVVTAMVERDRIPVGVVRAATVREPDGLAMSSRNVFLSPQDRARALAISRALREAGLLENAGDAESRLLAVLGSDGITPDYAVVREADTLMPLPGLSRRAGACRALIAARVGPVRLLDNAPWPMQR